MRHQNHRFGSIVDGVLDGGKRTNNAGVIFEISIDWDIEVDLSRISSHF
jgi:hypothetical protein